MPKFEEAFRRFAHWISELSGRPQAFLLALGVIVVWAVTGPLFGFSDTWQLVINTGTTIVTFLMVFLIQNTQNRDARAMQLKLDELIRAVRKAHNELIDIEECSDEELRRLQVQFRRLRDRHEPARAEAGDELPGGVTFSPDDSPVTNPARARDEKNQP